MPLTSGITRIGATPWCWAAQAFATSAAPPESTQSTGRPGVPCSSTITGSCGRGRWYQAGGTHTTAGRAAKCDAVPGIGICTT
ncbi:hypothetical protein WY02_24770 [Pseudonocardia sp. AL041005-10]|nr:hypothetical protein [Pseudonocardia sp. AL041005-10]ALE81066.1 hypothetical protein WY02_24770 [Pseudonocardia sp. AL041005-10]